MLESKKAKLFAGAKNLALGATQFSDLPMPTTLQIVLSLGSALQKLKTVKNYFIPFNGDFLII